MPNVMGQEFPYTPEGMAAAQQYAQAMGMRGGGSMGFRPIGMQEGGDADMVKLANDLYALMQGGTDEQVSNFIRGNRTALEMAAAIPDSKFNMLRGALKLNAQMQQMPETTGNLGRISDMDLQNLQGTMGSMPPMPETTGNPPRISDMDLQILQGALAQPMQQRAPAEFTGAPADRVGMQAGDPSISNEDLENMKRIVGSAATNYYPPNYSPPEKRAGGGIMSLRGY